MSISNEQLALRIQQGETALYNDLWEQTKKLLLLKTNSFYKANEELLTRHGLTLDDLQQTAFLALVFAVKSFNPEKGYKLTSYFNFALKIEFRAALDGGTRKSKKTNPLDICDSLDRPASEEDGDAAIGDFIHDTAASEELLNVEEDIYNRQAARVLWDGVNRLPNNNGEIIIDRFMHGLTLKQIGEKHNITNERVRNIEGKALRQLRSDREIRSFFSERINVYRGSGLSTFKNTGMSSVERAVELLDEIQKLKIAIEEQKVGNCGC